MLTHTQETTTHRSDGTEVKDHTATLILPDYHMEYTSAAWTNDPSRTHWKHDDWYRAEIVWDEMNVLDTLAACRDLRSDASIYDNAEVAEAKRLIFNVLFSPVLDEHEVAENYVWMLTGSRRGLARAWVHLYEALDAKPSGDDDFFDYWPNSMDVLWRFSEDLDGWKHAGNHHRTATQELARRVWDRVGPQQIAGDRDGDYDLRTEWGGPWLPEMGD
jgi:hypothetical protein